MSQRVTPIRRIRFHPLPTISILTFLPWGRFFLYSELQRPLRRLFQAAISFHSATVGIQIDAEGPAHKEVPLDKYDWEGLSGELKW